MRILILFQSALCLLIFCSAVSAQQASKGIKVSREVLAGPTGGCSNLTVGKAALSVPPKYPDEARTARLGGRVKVSLLIDEKGGVSKILGIEGHKLLKRAATDAALKIKFTPTKCDGVPISVKGLVVYRFSPYVFTESYFVPDSIEGFLDIDRDSDYYEPILYLTENYKLAFGFRDKKFHVSSPITRGEFAHFLRNTLDLLRKRAALAKKDPEQLDLYRSYNPRKIEFAKEIVDLNPDSPYAESLDVLISKYDIAFVDNEKRFVGNLPMTHNEVLAGWGRIFGSDALPVNFEKIKEGDRILSRGEFALFLQESLYVLTYKVLP